MRWWSEQEGKDPKGDRKFSEPIISWLKGGLGSIWVITHLSWPANLLIAPYYYQTTIRIIRSIYTWSDYKFSNMANWVTVIKGAMSCFYPSRTGKSIQTQRHTDWSNGSKFNQRSGYGSGDLKRSLKILICNINYAGIYCCNWHNPQNIMVEISGKKPNREWIQGTDDCHKR